MKHHDCSRLAVNFRWIARRILEEIEFELSGDGRIVIKIVEGMVIKWRETWKRFERGLIGISKDLCEI